MIVEAVFDDKGADEADFVFVLADVASSSGRWSDGRWTWRVLIDVRELEHSLLVALIDTRSGDLLCDVMVR